MCKYAGVLVKKYMHIKKEEIRETGREEKKKESVQEDDKRKERYVCMPVKRSKRKDPFAKTVLY
jgi:hypothetical protein